MEHVLPELPYSSDSLLPFISPETIDFHHKKHHAGYVNKLNVAIKGTEFENESLEKLIFKTSGEIFNNAAQVWNHNFYWNCLTPKALSKPTGPLADAINEKWESFMNFKREFETMATTNFGSGWTWLVKKNNGKLDIVNTSNAQTPMTNNQTALLTLDVWEHAYYIDYRNNRVKYIQNFWKVANWDFANQNYVHA